jgi:hypothetical protein
MAKSSNSGPLSPNCCGLCAKYGRCKNDEFCCDFEDFEDCQMFGVCSCNPCPDFVAKPKRREEK